MTKVDAGHQFNPKRIAAILRRRNYRGDYLNVFTARSAAVRTEYGKDTARPAGSQGTRRSIMPMRSVCILPGRGSVGADLQ
jgi:hypothetical protein